MTHNRRRAKSGAAWNIRAMLVAGLVLLPGCVWAAEDTYRMTMTGCQPDAASIRNDTCRSGGHGVFANGNGPCRMICPMPITKSSEQWDGLQLFGRDPDGTGTSYRIEAHFKKAALGSRISQTLCSVDSNTGPSNSNYIARDCTRPTFTSFRPDASTWYWLEVILTRAAGARLDVEVLGYDIY